VAEIETDYLIVGAGASGLAFVDTLLSLDDEARVIIVDREDRPGGHWLHAYPFVRLHQPSAYYGVPSRRLGEDRIVSEGPDAGTYERAAAPEICEYWAAVLSSMLAGGRVRFLGGADFRGSDGGVHTVASVATGATTTVRASRLVDATCVASEIPSRHAPSYGVEEGVRLVPPNDVPGLADAPAFTVIGAGKTAMDTCTWLLGHGVDPDRVRWVKPREPWLFDRHVMQPLELVAQYMQMQAHWVAAAAQATDGHDFTRRLEADGVLVRVDPSVEADMFRGAILGAAELESLRSIERVVRLGKVRGLGTQRVELDGGEVPAQPGEVLVDCTAYGVRQASLRPVFEPGRVNLEHVTIGLATYGAATIAAVEALREDDADKNRLCPPLQWTGRTADVLELTHAGMTGLTARTSEADLGAWNEACRLNPAAGAMAKAADPEISAALTTIITELGPALDNLAQRAAAGEPVSR
jgi:cation diffusion facilitator CzcD-associated flavoprotein CzcO